MFFLATRLDFDSINLTIFPDNLIDFSNFTCDWQLAFSSMKKLLMWNFIGISKWFILMISARMVFVAVTQETNLSFKKIMMGGSGCECACSCGIRHPSSPTHPHPHPPKRMNYIFTKKQIQLLRMWMWHHIHHLLADLSTSHSTSESMFFDQKLSLSIWENNPFCSYIDLGQIDEVRTHKQAKIPVGLVSPAC